MGDLNLVLAQDKKSGGSWSLNTQSSLLDSWSNLGLLDLQFNGYPLTWPNLQERYDRIQERRGQVVAHPSWVQEYPDAYALHLPPTASDHLQILLHIKVEGKSFHKLFRFKIFWTGDQAFKYVVSQA